MEAKDTVMNKEKLKQINDDMPPEAKYGDVFEVIANTQNDITCKATLQEAGKWLMKNRRLFLDDSLIGGSFGSLVTTLLRGDMQWEVT